MHFLIALILCALGVAAPAVAGAQSMPPLGRRPDVIDQARQRALAPVPQGPMTPAPGQTWVPERRFFSPQYGRELVIPGHYETRISPQQSAVPPITSYGPLGENPILIPGGDRPPADVRQGP